MNNQGKKGPKMKLEEVIRIFLLLLDSELCVCELVAVLKLEQSLVSHQLRIMRQAGLVEGRKSGRWVFYRIPEACRKQLEPLFRSWLKDELAVSGSKVRDVKEKKICPVASALIDR
jgi:ArsR family transcriptional regulator